MAADESRAGGVYVLHAEPVAIQFETAAGQAFDMRSKSLDANPAGKFTASFDAFGRRFIAELEPNEKLNAVAKEHRSGAIALHGKLAGVKSSWVRLTQSGQTMHGMVWDGEQLIAIAPAQEVSSGNQSDEKTLIFRAADTVIDSTAGTCAAIASEETGSAGSMYKNLKTELGEKAITSASKRLLMSAIMDSAYVGRYSSKAEAVDALIARANNVDGIFTAELGIEIEVDTVLADGEDGAPTLSTATKADDLLGSVSRARAASSDLYATGITHLFTGRDLDGNTVGISYVGAMCSQRYGVALSEARSGNTWYESLIAAHELGHSFGADHDGTGECVATPTTFLMAPIIGNTERFSQCSVDRIQKYLPQHGCLTEMSKPDAAIAAQLGDLRQMAATDFEWTMSVTNLGSGDATGVRVRIDMPAQFTVRSATVQGAACDVGAGAVDCAVGQLPAQAVRDIRVTLFTQFAGSYQVSASVVADADVDTTNNAGQGSIVIEAPAVVSPPLPAPTPTPAPAVTISNDVTTPAAPESSSGGGAMHVVWLLALAALGRRRWLRLAPTS